jgi:hypothetical protein
MGTPVIGKCAPSDGKCPRYLATNGHRLNPSPKYGQNLDEKVIDRFNSAAASQVANERFTHERVRRLEPLMGNSVVHGFILYLSSPGSRLTREAPIQSPSGADVAQW